MLDPGIQTVLGSALRPPGGMQVDQAVVTTYSLNLTAMLLAPLTFALAEPDAVGAVDADPLRLLDAVQCHIGHTTVFVQAGGIGVPTSHSRIHTFLEDSVVQVEPPHPQGLFHPKVWAVRFTGSGGAFHHRLLIGSRNLTLDESWDTLLVLDESSDGQIDGEPAADFLAALPDMAVVGMDPSRQAAVMDLAATVGAARFSAPDPFLSGELLPLGLAGQAGHWPFPEPSRVRRTLAISPFVTAGLMRRLQGGSDPVLVSRPEQLDLLGAHVQDWSCRVLHDELVGGLDHVAETDPGGGDAGTAAAPDTETGLRTSGLHAKTVVQDVIGVKERSRVVTGSANLTDAAWERNVEFGAVLEGRTREVGVEATLGPLGGGMGLEQVLTRYDPVLPAPEQEEQIANSYALEAFHRAVAAALPVLAVRATGEEQAEAHLAVAVPAAPDGSTTRARLLTMPADTRSELRDGLAWTLAPRNVTPFLVLESTVGAGDARVTRRCMVMMHLTGDLLDRRQAYLEEVLDSENAVLRYLALLLGLDETHAAGLDHQDDVVERLEGLGEDGSGRSWEDVVLFEPLMRASTGDVDSLAMVAAQVARLRRSEKVRTLIPADFEQMWDTVLGVVAPEVLRQVQEVDE